MPSTITTAVNAVQKAVYTVLSGDATLAAKAGVYDDVPAKPSYPYVEVGDGYEIPDDTFGRQGRTVVFTLHIWSKAKGFKEANGILDDLNRLLDRAVLAPAGMTFDFCVYEQSQQLRDPDGFTRHVPARYRVLIEA